MIEAVIFDLFDTVVVGLDRNEYTKLIDELAGVMEVDRQALWDAWLPTQMDRMTGANGGLEGDLEQLTRAAGGTVSAERIRKAASLKLEYFRHHLVPREGAADTIGAIRAGGRKVACLTNCAREAELLWDESPLADMFDVTVFSSAEGMAKPDPRIYLRCAHRSGVGPGNCMFVGDGANNELSGARDAGMSAVMLLNDYVPVAVTRESVWEPAVRKLEELLPLLEQGTK